MSGDPERLVKRVREAWGRPELSPAEQAEFDDGVRARVERTRPRRWLWIGAVTAATAVAVVAMSVRDTDVDPDWLDVLADAQAVVEGEGFLEEEALAFGFESSEASVPLFADPGWDSSADAVWDSESSLVLGNEYQVLAFWLAPTTDGNSAANTPDVP